jgi:hypothetical protein
VPLVADEVLLVLGIGRLLDGDRLVEVPAALVESRGARTLVA